MKILRSHAERADRERARKLQQEPLVRPLLPLDAQHKSILRGRSGRAWLLRRSQHVVEHANKRHAESQPQSGLALHRRHPGAHHVGRHQCLVHAQLDELGPAALSQLQPELAQQQHASFDVCGDERVVTTAAAANKSATINQLQHKLKREQHTPSSKKRRADMRQSTAATLAQSAAAAAVRESEQQ